MDAHNLIPVQNNDQIEEFNSGDTVRVNVRVVEGDRVRNQAFEGVVIRKRGSGQGKTFTVRRIAHQIGVERTFLICSPNIDSLKVISYGRVRRARLYYLRALSGKSARIKQARRN
jgi:large subunit ribosomal protein L19